MTSSTTTFFPDLGNLFINDMSDNINHIGSAPAVQYVILSSWFSPHHYFDVCNCRHDLFTAIRIKSHTKLPIYSTIQSENLITGNLLRVVLLRF